MMGCATNTGMRDTWLRKTNGACEYMETTRAQQQDAESNTNQNPKQINKTLPRMVWPISSDTVFNPLNTPQNIILEDVALTPSASTSPP